MTFLGSCHRNEPNTKPFNLLQEYESFVKYSRQWSKMYCFYVRILEQSDSNPTSQQWCSVLSETEQQMLQQLVEFARQGDTSTDFDNLIDKFEYTLLTRETMAAFDHPMSIFLAVAAINKEIALEEPEYHTQKLAAVLWCCRVSLYSTFRAEHKQQTGRQLLQEFFTFREAFLLPASMSPVASILATLAYGKGITKDEFSEPIVSWSDNNDLIDINGTKLRVSQLKTFASKLQQDLMDDFDKLVFGDNTPDFDINLETVRGYPQDKTVGLTFFDHPGNMNLVGSDFMMFEHALNNDSTLVTLRNNNGIYEDNNTDNMSDDTDKSDNNDNNKNNNQQLQLVEWHGEHVKKYEKSVVDFVKKLAVLVHIVYGQPSRGTEFVELNISNLRHRTRDVNVYGGLISLTPRYSKTLSITGKRKKIARFPDKVTSTLLAKYICFLHPFR